MINPNDFDCIVFLIPKSVVEEQDLDFMLSGLQKLIKNEETIRKSKNKVTIGFDGYDDDPREVYDIDEIRSYIQDVSLKFPYWFYFCNTKDHSLWIILLAHCRFRKFGPGVAKVLNEDAKKTYNVFLANLINFYEEHNLCQTDFVLLSKDVCNYFESRQIPSL